MNGYLGETIIDIKDSEFKNYCASDWVLWYMQSYGGFYDSHHKDWLLDQIARLSNRMVPKISLAKWDNGHQEYRITLHNVKETEQYINWVAECKRGEDGPDTYNYNIGITP